ncbi:MAG: hypothetical protein MRERC_1c181 [Mycoplasmataceae bacterium RC_NB112A]|nr:MAG: hypothetical protein MRERC_1c181 [Mycoplasmataceae bacterium RC_NB112A]
MQEQIAEKEVNLEKKFAEVKCKLRSKSFFYHKIREREKNLDSLLKNIHSPKEFKKELENIKQGLSGNLTDQEIKELWKEQNELVQMKEKIKQLKNSKAQ